VPKSVVTNAHTIEILTLQLRFWAENTGVGVSQLAAATMGIPQNMSGWTTQRIDNTVRDHVWVILQSICIITKHVSGTEQWDLLFDYCITQTSDPESKITLWKRYIAEETNFAHQKLKVALDEFAEVRHSQ
jgi:hypothetical protein